jgi:hypothetical protein
MNNMIQKLGFLIVGLSVAFTCLAGEVVLNGVYQGKNLYVMNPFSSTGGFCIKEVNVNGQKTNDDINSSAFEIDLSVYQFNAGDKLIITITHKDDCKPRVLNEDVIKPRSTFEVKTLRFDVKTNTITWETTKESGALPYFIEQFRWNKWVRIGTIEGTGDVNQNSYSFAVDLHSGVNRFRIRQRDFSNKDRFTKEISARSAMPPVTYEPKKPTTSITFNVATTYEIFNSSGTRVLHGKGTTIDISGLPKGDYFLNYDAVTEPLKKR